MPCLLSPLHVFVTALLLKLSYQPFLYCKHQEIKISASLFCRKGSGKDREAKFECQLSMKGAGAESGHWETSWDTSLQRHCADTRTGCLEFPQEKPQIHCSSGFKSYLRKKKDTVFCACLNKIYISSPLCIEVA